MLQDAFAHPVEAQAAGLIVAAIAIALAALLLFYLLKPRTIRETTHYRNRECISMHAPAAPSVTSRTDDLRKDLAYQRLYVDHSQIRR